MLTRLRRRVAAAAIVLEGARQYVDRLVLARCDILVLAGSNDVVRGQEDLGRPGALRHARNMQLWRKNEMHVPQLWLQPLGTAMPRFCRALQSV